MRVVFLEDVAGVALGGEVKEVKNGFARNHLIPKGLASPATHNALQGVARLGKEAEENRLKTLADMRAVAEALDGIQVNVEMRAGARGHLYGSVTDAIIADEIQKLTGREIDRRAIEIAEPIRDLGTYDVMARLHSEVQANLKVLVYATGTDPTAQEEEAEVEEGADKVDPAGDETAGHEGEETEAEGETPETEGAGEAGQ